MCVIFFTKKVIIKSRVKLLLVVILQYIININASIKNEKCIKKH